MGARDSDKAGTSIPVKVDLWCQAFPYLAPILKRIGSQGRYDTYATAVLDRWTTGRIALVGDSAHAMPPTLGQGAGCAMMNGLSLPHLVAQTGDLERGLVKWERLERPLTDHTQDIARQYAATHAGRDGRSKWDADALRAAHHVPLGAGLTA
jgi:2-methyl-3-hydroxypyridine 5-carboxylic acid dioxygenase